MLAAAPWNERILVPIDDVRIPSSTWYIVHGTGCVVHGTSLF